MNPQRADNHTVRILKPYWWLTELCVLFRSTWQIDHMIWAIKFSIGMAQYDISWIIFKIIYVQWCWWLCDSDRLNMLIMLHLCTCMWLIQCIKSVTNIDFIYLSLILHVLHEVSVSVYWYSGHSFNLNTSTQNVKCKLWAVQVVPKC